MSPEMMSLKRDIGNVQANANIESVRNRKPPKSEKPSFFSRKMWIVTGVFVVLISGAIIIAAVSIKLQYVSGIKPVFLGLASSVHSRNPSRKE
jgi:hypothetical protein